ncbi:hypothetical protein Ahy_B02g059151 [Arachis hypogaea]|uniref:Aminotransferase-like plant mobile domain-containing protein n=1 Tax=Arachis hypogaea TaxID=3818 RepID=A0A445AGA6_ARAHY|nr:hypothetical protein Ahy_B02g059151 [Arachis hypogaea]
MPVGEVTVTLEDVLHLFGLPIDGEVVTGWTDSSHNFLAVQSLAIFDSKPQNFDQIGNYIWGSAYLANLYKSLCRASRYNCKEMDGPLDLLFVWVWERMPRLASIPRHQLAPAEIPVARRPYVGIIIAAELHAHLDVCDTVGPLVSFECVEWLPVDRVVHHCLRDRGLQPIVDFTPSADYRSWYIGSYGMYLRLSEFIYQHPPQYPPQQAPP